MRMGRRIVVTVVAAASISWAADTPTIDAAALVRQTVDNETKTGDHTKFMFQDRKQTPNGTSTKLIVETKEATAGLVIAYDDKPLGPKQRQDELQRVQRFIDNPDELRKKAKQEKEDADRVTRIMRALPDAFVYQVVGKEQGANGVGKPGAELVKLSFEPNPKYDPPSRVEQVLVGMNGYLLIDASQKRLARIDGNLFKDVGFGWGILGHLDRGGHFLVEQGDVNNGHWDITRMNLKFTGKILLFKKLDIESQETCSGFRSVPADLTFAQGVELLKKQQEEIAQK